MSSFSDRKPSEEDLLGCWEIVACRLSDDCYPAVEGVQFHLEEGGDLIWKVPPASEQETLPFFSCETFVFDSFSGELVCYGNNVDKIALKCTLESSQLVLCYDRHLKLCCQKVNEVDSENLLHHPYSLLPALKEGFFSDITFISSNGEKFLAHKTILSCFFADIYKWDKIPPFLEGLPSDVLYALLHYLYTCSLPSNISDDTARQLLRIVQLNGKDIGNLGDLCTEFLEATAVKNRIRGLVSELYGIMEYVLQMVETLTAGLRHSSGGTQTVSCGHLQRIDPSKITDVTKMVLRKLSIGTLKFVLLCDIFTKHKSDLSREERQEIIQHCRKSCHRDGVTNSTSICLNTRRVLEDNSSEDDDDDEFFPEGEGTSTENGNGNDTEGGEAEGEEEAVEEEECREFSRWREEHRGRAEPEVEVEQRTGVEEGVLELQEVINSLRT
ncbi:hypothetical protein ACROYT_G036741 [Oculina patagonica]